MFVGKSMLNERIRELRRAFGLSQVELAGAMNVSKQCVSNWENDNVQPSIDMLVKLADYFRVTTDYLLCRDEKDALDLSGLSERERAHLKLLVMDLLNKS